MSQDFVADIMKSLHVSSEANVTDLVVRDSRAITNTNLTVRIIISILN
jgi:hypothetical protein